MRTAWAWMGAAAMSVVVVAARGADDKAVAAIEGAGWRAERVELDVYLEPAERRARFEGTARLRLEEESARAVTLAVGWRDGIFEWERLSVTGAEGAAELNFTADSAEKARLARVALARPAARGDEVEVSFAYRSVGEGFQFVVSPGAACASWTSAWSAVALPGASAGGVSPALLRRAGVVRMHVPLEWRTLCVGKLVGREEKDGGAVETWEVGADTAASFAAGPYTVAWHDVDGRKIGVYLLSPKAQSAEKQAATLGAALRAQEALFGAYPYPSYAIAEMPEGLVKWYASSEQGFIMATSTAFREEHGNLPLWAHEMAHGWWGNLVSADGAGSKWVSESLAQYSAVAAIEALEGKAAAAEFLEFSRSGYNPVQSALGYFWQARSGQDMALSKMDGANPWEHNLSDNKGHWVYHMLRGRVSDEVFYATLRGVIAAHAGSELTVDAMRRAFIDAAPEKGLEQFFAQWLDRPGAPVVDVDWWSTDRGTGVHVEVKQRQEGEAYALPIEIAVDLKGGGEQRFTLDVKEREQAFDFETKARAVGVRIDPDRAALIWRPEYGPRPEAGKATVKGN